MSGEVVDLKSERRSRAIQEQENDVRIAIHNEALTRKRVEALEGFAEGTARLLARGLWGRLTWLLFGR